MTTLDDDFKLRIGKIGRDDSLILGPLKGAVGSAKRIGRSGRKQSSGDASPKGIRPHFAKAAGRAAASNGFSGASRRVVVKARIVPHGVSGAAPLKAHVSYLARESRDAQKQQSPQQELQLDPDQAAPELSRQVDYLSRKEVPGRSLYEFYDGARDAVDAKAITANWAADVRHFRLIISPEDGAALGDLKPFIREVVADLEHRLGTKLEWVAADHWDTDNPHSHVLIRGRRADGADLVIPRKIISYEIRERAQAIVTRALGPRPMLSHELALEQARAAEELIAPRLTQLDREIISATHNGLFVPPARGRKDIMVRLERLEIWSLVAQQADGRWSIAPNLAVNLQSLGEKVEVTRLLERVEGLALAEYDILAADPKTPALGRLVHVGPLDELSDRQVAIIEDSHGHLRYAGFDRTSDLAVFEGAIPGAVLEFTPSVPVVRPADKAVARIAENMDGLYSANKHLYLEPQTDRPLIEGNLRRLEAMRRANLVQRRPDGVFEVAPDHLARALKFETKLAERAPLSVRAVSYWTLAEQERALGPTQLDRVLSRQELAPEGVGKFARDFEQSLQRRRLFLIEQGYMARGHSALSQNSIQRLAMAELERTASKLETELGRPVLTYQTNRIEGIYARRIDLAQGRYALIWQKDTAHLVEWRPALEQFAGRRVQGLARGRSIAWSLMKERSIPLPPM
jgi:hypothetical protein